MHPNVNPNDQGRRNKTYPFDKTRTTIKQQTEDHIHSRINPNDEARRNTTYPFDKTRTTIKEQTEDGIHGRINPVAGGNTEFQPHDITQYQNASINALKEWAIVKDRAPAAQGAIVTRDKDKIGRLDVFRRQQFDTYKFSKGYDPTAPSINSKFAIGQDTKPKEIYPRNPFIMANRHDPAFVQQFQNNPFTQSLNSHFRSQFPSYPVVRTQPKFKK